MKACRIYYNPKCGTCQKVLAALRDKGLEPVTIEYLKTPPSEAELDAILKMLDAEPLAIVRQKEPLYQEKFAGKTFTRAQWLKILHENPVLIERPIVVLGDRALIARPPEKLTSFL